MKAMCHAGKCKSVPAACGPETTVVFNSAGCLYCVRLNLFSQVDCAPRRVHGVQDIVVRCGREVIAKLFSSADTVSDVTLLDSSEGDGLAFSSRA